MRGNRYSAKRCPGNAARLCAVALYAPYAHLITLPGGLSALQDQQLGAGIMWTFGDFPLVIVVGVLFQQWLASQSDGDQTAPQPETVSAGPK